MPLPNDCFKTPSPLGKRIFQTIGDSGTERYSGYFQEEPNPEWRDEQRVDNVETMRRTDGTVKQLLNALKAPILSTEWFVEPVSDDPLHIEQAQFAEKNLFNMERTWKNFLRESLTYFDFGFSCFELVWTKSEDGIRLKDMEPRIQHSIQDWKVPNKGGGMTRGITQWIKTDEFCHTHSRISCATGSFQVNIPINKLLVLTNDKEGDDITGQSVLRPAWKHFYIKDTLYRVSAISAERFGVGIPKVTMPSTIGESDQDKAQEMASQIRANEKGLIVLPNEEWKIEIMVPNGNPQCQQIQELIMHHDRMILSSSLAGFLNLGSGATGSFALSKDQSGFFLKHVEDKACYLAQEITKQVVEKIINFNFGKQEKYPELKFTPLGDIDMKEFSETMKIFVEAGFINPQDQDIQKFIRKAGKLPKKLDIEEDGSSGDIEKEVNENDLEEEINEMMGEVKIQDSIEENINESV